MLYIRCTHKKHVIHTFNTTSMMPRCHTADMLYINGIQEAYYTYMPHNKHVIHTLDTQQACYIQTPCSRCSYKQIPTQQACYTHMPHNKHIIHTCHTTSIHDTQQACYTYMPHKHIIPTCHATSMLYIHGTLQACYTYMPHNKQLILVHAMKDSHKAIDLLVLLSLLNRSDSSSKFQGEEDLSYNQNLHTMLIISVIPILLVSLYLSTHYCTRLSQREDNVTLLQLYATFIGTMYAVVTQGTTDIAMALM